VRVKQRRSNTLIFLPKRNSAGVQYGQIHARFQYLGLSTLGIDLYVRNTLGIGRGLLTIGLGIDPNLSFLARFNPIIYIYRRKCHTLTHPKMALRCITRAQWNLVTHSRWRFAVLHVPTHSGSNTLSVMQ